MMKRWKLILILLVAAFIAIVVYRGTVSTCSLPSRPFPSHTFDMFVAGVTKMDIVTERKMLNQQRKEKRND